MPRASTPTANTPQAVTREMPRLEQRISASTMGSRRSSTSAKGLGLSK